MNGHTLSPQELQHQLGDLLRPYLRGEPFPAVLSAPAAATLLDGLDDSGRVLLLQHLAALTAALVTAQHRNPAMSPRDLSRTLGRD